MENQAQIIKKSLLIGCGSRRQKMQVNESMISFVDFEPEDGLITLDINPNHNPDIVFDLNGLGRGFDFDIGKFPFEDNYIDEIHAYEVLEHLGTQGDYRHFFDEFSEYWRILKPGGKFIGTVPAYNSPWAFGDPSHTRVIPLESFIFLSQKEYQRQVGKTAMSDFRFCYSADFITEFAAYIGDNAYFILEAIKDK